MRRGKMESAEDRADIPDMRTQLVRRGIVRFITPAMATGVEQDKLVMWPQGVDIPMTRPTLHVPGHPVLQNQSWAFPLYTIVDSDSLVGRERHGGQLLLRPGLAPWVIAAERNRPAAGASNASSGPLKRLVRPTLLLTPPLMGPDPL